MINQPEVDVEELFPNKPPPVVLLDVPNNPVPDDDVVAVVDEPNENPVEAELVAAGFAPNNPPVLFVVFVVLDCPNVNVMALNKLNINRENDNHFDR